MLLRGVPVISRRKPTFARIVALEVLQLLRESGYLPSYDVASQALSRDKTSKQEPSCCIYALCDPETDDIHYIGKANDADDRYAQHVYQSLRQTERLLALDPTPKERWIRELARAKKEPKLRILEDGVPLSKAREAERKWIKWALSQGFDLTNVATV